MVTKGEYKGHATLTLKNKEDDQKGFTFGLNKAKLILSNLDDIKAFVEESEKKNEPQA